MPDCVRYGIDENDPTPELRAERIRQFEAIFERRYFSALSGNCNPDVHEYHRQALADFRRQYGLGRMR